MMDIPTKINSYSFKQRIDSLRSIVNLPEIHQQSIEQINLHVHSFYSYNAKDWSPSRIALEAKKKKLPGIGIIDFDVIDAREEIIKAGEILSLKTSLGLETRTFYDSFSNVEIDSPGEPGVSYVAGAGFINPVKEESAQYSFLQKLKQTAKERNTKLIERINRALPDIKIDYATDVLSLTPSGNATERHIVKAYLNKAQEIFPDIDRRVKFWNDILQRKDCLELLKEENKADLENIVRNKLAKRGGIGYVQPSENTFPPVADVFSWMQKCDSIPLESWLDGTSEGEKNPEKLLETSIEKGAKGLNIIPDRNWNIKDPETQKVKYSNLKRIIEIADKLHLPIHIGTEMNKDGQPFYDDLNNPFLSPFRESILRGANVIFGHNLLTRFAEFSYVGENAHNEFKKNIEEKNTFFKNVGKLPALNEKNSQKLQEKSNDTAFAILTDSATKGKWII